MTNKPIAMRDALIEQIGFAMETDPTVFFVSADFGSPKLDKIRNEFPERFLNVGIAEQNLINVSAGLALEGFKVFAYAIAPFITMRCYEQTRVSLALLSNIRSMNVNLIGVGAGCSYVVSGPTHQCYEDITLMRAMPNFRVLSPADHVSAAALISTCLHHSGPKYLRLDAQVLPALYDPQTLDLSRGFVIHNDAAVAQPSVVMLATGYMVHTALETQYLLRLQGVSSVVIDCLELSRFDGSSLIPMLAKAKHVMSLEEGFVGRGGLDAVVLNLLNKRGITTPFTNVGIEGGYRFEIGSRAELHRDLGLSPDMLARRAVTPSEMSVLDLG